MCTQYNSCGCQSCPTYNPSNKTQIIPVAGKDAYQLWLSYNPTLDPSINPDSPWTESYWLANYAKGEKGDKGDGVQIKDSVPTYADLAGITPTPTVGDSYYVIEDGMIYVYGETGFPAQGEGLDIKGEQGDTYVPITTTSYFD